MKLSEKMREAIGYVQRGWCKNDLERNGAVCARGAINIALYGNAAFKYPDCCIRDSDFSKLDHAVSTAALAWGFNDTADFNNAHSTTQQDVIAAMEKAAMALEERGE